MLGFVHNYNNRRQMKELELKFQPRVDQLIKLIDYPDYRKVVRIMDEGKFEEATEFVNTCLLETYTKTLAQIRRANELGTRSRPETPALVSVLKKLNEDRLEFMKSWSAVIIQSGSAVSEVEVLFKRCRPRFYYTENLG